jgi:hypothetical protein
MIYVQSDDPALPVCQLEMTATLVPRLTVTPGSLDFGQVCAGDAVRTRLMVSCEEVPGLPAPAAAVTIKSTGGDLPGLRAHVAEVSGEQLRNAIGHVGRPVLVIDAARYLITAELDTTGLAPGTRSGVLELATGLPDHPSLRIPIAVTVVPRVAAYPGRVHLARASTARDATADVLLRSRTHDLITVLSVSSDVPELQCHFPTEPAAELRLRFRLPPPSAGQPRITGSATVRVEDGQGGRAEELVLPVYAYLAQDIAH